jgi:hypothetical protein
MSRLINTSWPVSALKDMRTLAAISCDVRNPNVNRTDIIQKLLLVDFDRAMQMVEDLDRILKGEETVKP